MSEQEKWEIEKFIKVYSLPCYDFLGENEKVPKKVSVMIAPIKLIYHSLPSGERTILIKWGCSRGSCCKEKTCRYSDEHLK